MTSFDGAFLRDKKSQWHLKTFGEFLCTEWIVKTYPMRKKQCVVNYSLAYEKLIQANFACKTD